MPTFTNHITTSFTHTHSLHDALPISAIQTKRAAPEGAALDALTTISWSFALPGNRLIRRRADCRPRICRNGDRKSTRLNSSHLVISYAVFCLKKKKTISTQH